MDLHGDLRTAARRLGTRPFSRTAAVAALALGMGTSAALFSLVDAVHLRPLPWPAAGRLVAFWDAMPELGHVRARVSGFNYLRLREQSRSFESLALLGSTSGTLAGLQEPVEVEGFRVTCNTFRLLGVRAQRGRLLVDADCGPRSAPAMVISDALWRRRFGADPGIVGRPVALDGRPVTVVGVTPAALLPAVLVGEGRFLFSESEETVFVPLDPVPDLHGHVYGVLGRLKEGVSVAAARAEAATLAEGWRRAFPATHAGYAPRVVPLSDELLGSSRQPLWALLASALVLLAVACINVAHFQLEGVIRAERSSAVRAALGATRAQVARPFVLEGLLLSVAGGLLGTGLAQVALRSGVRLLPRALPRVESAHLDARALAVVGTLVLLAGSATGLVAGFRAGRGNLSSALAGGRGLLRTGSPGLRQLLLGAQAALAVVLVALALLLVSSLDRLARVETGFGRGELLVVDLRHGTQRYRERAQLVGFYDALLARVAALPGVLSVGASYDPPLHSNWYQSFTVLDAPEPPPGREPGALFRTVTPGYFAAAGLRIAEGRGFTDADGAEAAGAVIVNRALARRFFDGRPPLGRRISLTTTQWIWGEAIPRIFTVIGVAADERIAGLAVAPEPAFYLPYRQTPQHQMSVLVRTSVDAASLLPAVTKVVHSVDPGQAVAASTTLRGILSEQLARPRLNALLAAGFGLAALGLAAIGVSACLAQSVSRRTAELGVRMALGASRQRVFALALRDGLRPTFLGAAVGASLALGAGRLVASQLFAVQAWDPGLHAAALGGVLAVAALAGAVPAWRAAGTDPAVALRQDA